MDDLADLPTTRAAAQRRAVLAERLLLDLGEARTRHDAASLLVQAMQAIGGADAVRILQRDQDAVDSPAVVLAEAGHLDGAETSTITDGASGLELTLTATAVPPLALSRALRALASVLQRLDAVAASEQGPAAATGAAREDEARQPAFG